MKKSILDPFEAFALKNFNSIVGGAETYTWRAGSSMQYVNMSSNDDEELVSSGSSGSFIDGAYDCGEGRMAWDIWNP